jgi:enoyl-CoA hydratase/carnithine racemase
MAYESLQCTRVDVDGGVAWATIDHPPMNLWDSVLTADLVALIGAFEADGEARVLVLTSADPEYFIAHADVEMILGLPTNATAAGTQPAPINQLLERLRLMPKISIALLRGIARGGGSEISLACDLRIATPAPGSRSPRSRSASSPVPAAPSASPGSSAGPERSRSSSGVAT